MTKIFHNQIRQMYAKLAMEDGSAEDLVKLKSVELHSQGKLYKVLNASFAGGSWTTPVLFTKKERPGDYEVHWNFSFNGEPLDPQIEYITLQNLPSIHTGAKIEVEDVAGKDIEEDNTLPQEVKDLLVSYIG